MLKQVSKRFLDLLLAWVGIAVVGAMIAWAGYGVVFGYMYIPKRRAGLSESLTLTGLAARVGGLGVLLLLAGWFAYMRKSDHKRIAWNRAGIVLMLLGALGIFGSIFIEAP